MNRAIYLSLVMTLAMAASRASAGIQIPVVDVQASSERTTQFAIHTVDGSGITGTVPTAQHTFFGSGTNMWRTETGDISDAFIQWDLGKVYSLDTIHVWNYHADITLGIQQVDIYVSTNAVPGDPEGAGAANWTLLGGGNTILPQGIFVNTYLGFDLETATGLSTHNLDARFVRFEVDSNYGNASWVGLAEVQFFVPEPTSVVLLVLGGALMMRYRRRK